MPHPDDDVTSLRATALCFAKDLAKTGLTNDQPGVDTAVYVRDMASMFEAWLARPVQDESAGRAATPSALDAVRAFTERAHWRATHSTPIEDEYERGGIHALDDVYRLLPSPRTSRDETPNGSAPNPHDGLTIQAGGPHSTGRITLNGTEVTGVTEATLRLSAEDRPTLDLTLWPSTVTASGIDPTDVRIDDATADTLVALGWTRPGERDAATTDFIARQTDAGITLAEQRDEALEEVRRLSARLLAREHILTGERDDARRRLGAEVARSVVAESRTRQLRSDLTATVRARDDAREQAEASNQRADRLAARILELEETTLLPAVVGETSPATVHVHVHLDGREIARSIPQGR